MTRMPGSVVSTRCQPAAQAVPAPTVASSHGKAIAKRAPGRRPAKVGQTNTDASKISSLLKAGTDVPVPRDLPLQHFFSEKTTSTTPIPGADRPLPETRRIYRARKIRTLPEQLRSPESDHAPDHDFSQSVSRGAAVVAVLAGLHETFLGIDRRRNRSRVRPRLRAGSDRAPSATLSSHGATENPSARRGSNKSAGVENPDCRSRHSSVYLSTSATLV